MTVSHDVSVAELIRRGFHSVLFQPICHAGGGEPYGFEALMRGPAGTQLEHPGPLFRNGEIDRALLHELDADCLGSALRLGRVLGGLLFVNVHGETLLRQGHERDRIERLLTAMDIDPHRIVLEISETTEKSHVAAVKRGLQPLRDLGVRLALDDVGTFNDWLHQMMSLEPEFMKVDRQFISDIDSNPGKARLLRGFVAFARATAARLIVEGVEREEEYATVVDCGVDLVQGFLFGRPEPVQSWVDCSADQPDQTRVSAIFE